MAEFLNLLLAGLFLGGLYGMLALPLTLAWRATGVFDIAVGGYVVAAGLVAADIGGVAGVLAGIGVGMALALLTMVCFLAFRVVYGEGEVSNVALATFGLVIAITAGAQIWLGTDPRYLPLVEGTWTIGDIVLVKSRVIAFAISVALVLLVVGALAHTSLGLRIRASAAGPGHAELLGIRVRRLQCGAFIIGGALAGITGVLVASTTGLIYSSTVQFSVLALSAAVLLGLRGPGTAFLGGIVLGVFESLSQAYVGALIAGVLPSVLLLVVLASGLTSRGGTQAVRP